MQIEYLRIRNFRVFNDVKVENIPQMAVFLGKNGLRLPHGDVRQLFLHPGLGNPGAGGKPVAPAGLLPGRAEIP